MVKAKRDYKREYEAYHGKPAQIKRRAERVQARRVAVRKGLVSKGDGMEVHHLGSHRTGSLAKVPTRVVTMRENRARQPKRT